MSAKCLYLKQKHLDIRHHTICAGSQYTDCAELQYPNYYIPIVYCHQNRVAIDIGHSCWDATFAGSRQVVL